MKCLRAQSLREGCIPSIFYATNEIRNFRVILTESVTTVVPPSNSPIIYTDGSKIDSSVCAAFAVILNDRFIFEHRIVLRKLHSIYQAGLLAIDCHHTPLIGFSV